MLSFYTHKRHGKESREGLGARSPLRVHQPPVSVQIPPEVEEFHTPVLRDLELGAVVTVEAIRAQLCQTSVAGNGG